MLNWLPDLNHRVSRRTLLQAAGLWGCSLVLPFKAAAMESGQVLGELHSVEKKGALMGTFINLKALCASRQQGLEALEKAYEEMARLSVLLDWRRSITPVGALNEAGRLELPPLEMSENLALAHKYYRLTGGAFDISVLPVFQLLRHRFQADSRPPSKAEIKEMLSLVGSHHMTFDRKGVRFQRSGMAITLDGVAKGYIVDRGLEIIKKSGVEDCLVSAGGDIRVSSSTGSGRHWRIGVRDPRVEGEHLTIIHLDDGAVATSGSYEIYFDAERRYHHLLNPVSGMPAAGNVSVTVKSATAAGADALATALFMMDHHEALRLTASLPDTCCLIVDREGRQWRSGAWMQRSLPAERAEGSEKGVDA